MPTRSVKSRNAYDKYRKQVKSDSICQFCQIDSSSPQQISESKYFRTITNLFPYDLWDGQGVDHHIMIIPKKHTTSIAEFTDTEAVEFVNLLATYESQGYNVYARAPGNKIKSVVHQHTHLIKSSRKLLKTMVFIRKPYILFHR